MIIQSDVPEVDDDPSPCLCGFCGHGDVYKSSGKCCSYIAECARACAAADVLCVTKLPKLLKMMDNLCFNTSSPNDFHLFTKQ